ncbi:MAG TPA: saccharopine dehydrogenase [Xanthomonadales bacterium]|nr:saccharopine dehydrogenase [Xanthomonadales bacterium]
MAFRVVVIGGGGAFGSRAARLLAADAEISVHTPSHRELDVLAPDLRERLAALAPGAVIHCAGPFQQRDYRVAEACIDCGAHYVDLADAREFVAGIGALHERASARDRLVVAGASSVPGLSSAVVDAFRAEFPRLDAIDVGISPGNRAPRGTATVASTLAGVGRPHAAWREGEWRFARGWTGLRRFRFRDPCGERWLADCEVPDVALFPARYGVRERVTFGAGLELRRMQFGLALIAHLVELGIWRRPERHARTLRRISERWLSAGSDVGAMFVRLEGGRRVVTWQLVARAGDGPNVPAAVSVAIVRALARGTLATRGAMPCLGVVSLAEILDVLSPFAIETFVERS